MALAKNKQLSFIDKFTIAAVHEQQPVCDELKYEIIIDMADDGLSYFKRPSILTASNTRH